MEKKKCVRCNQEKPKTDEFFFYRKKSKGWLSSWCKQCKRDHRKNNIGRELELQRKRRGNKPHSELISKAAKENKVRDCLICGCNLNGTRKHKYCSTCRVCVTREQKRQDKSIRKKRVRQRTPKWANVDEIKAVYRMRDEMNKNSTVFHHVDHVIPLYGRFVSGLHVASNLRIITASENMSKSNHYSLEHNGSK